MDIEAAPIAVPATGAKFQTLAANVTTTWAGRTGPAGGGGEPGHRVGGLVVGWVWPWSDLGVMGR